MSIELKQAAQQALEALETEQALRHGYSYRAGVRIVSTADKAINALRTAIQQAEAKTDEPIYQICKADSVSVHSAWVDVDKQAYDDAGLYPEYRRRMLYTNPPPGVPDGHVLVPIEPTEKMLLAYTGGALTEAGFRWCRHQWAAMLAASPAQKGGE